MVFRKIKKYLNVYAVFIKICITSQMEYRFNFFMNMLLSVICLLLRSSYVYFVYKTNIVIDGMSADMLLLFTGISSVFSGIYALFFVENFCNIPDYIKYGVIDTLIIKPLSLQFFITCRYVNFGLSLPDLFGGAIMITVACRQLNIVLGWVRLLWFIGLVILGIVIMYSIFLFPYVFSFWLIEITSLNNIMNSIFDLNNLPMKVYGEFAQKIGMYVLPMFAITNFPFMYLIDELTINHVLIAILVTFFMTVLIKIFWNSGIKNYSSSNC